MINTDAVFTIGDTHKTCEDYALAGEWNGIPYLVVSDGCSSSDKTDVGSRLLAHCAVANLVPFFVAGYEAFGSAVIRDADNIARRLGLDTSILDATLLVCMKMPDDNFRVYMYGDGVVMTNGADGPKIDIIDFTSGAPFYLSYWLDKERLKRYDSQFGSNINAEIKWLMESGETITCEYNTQLVIDIPAEGLETIVLGTDGLQSFYPKPGVMQAEKPLAHFNQLMAFKNINGDFMSRRLKRWLDGLKKTGIYHGDDIGLAALTIK